VEVDEERRSTLLVPGNGSALGPRTVLRGEECLPLVAVGEEARSFLVPFGAECERLATDLLEDLEGRRELFTLER